MTRHVVAFAIALLLGRSIAVIPAQKSGPIRDCQWPGDKAHHCILFVDGEDIVLVDSAGRQIIGEDNLRTPPNGKAT
jgi:hypothetical protein